MNTFARTLGLAFLLLILFLAAVLASRVWMHQEEARLQREATASLQTRASEAVKVMARPPEQWTAEDFERVGGLLGARVSLTPAATTRPAPALVVDLPATESGLEAPSHPKLVLRFTAPLPPTSRLLLVQERLILSLLILGLVLLAVISVVGLSWFLRREPSEPLQNPSLSASREIQSLERLAKTSVERQHLLESERAVRERTQQDLEFNQQLLSRALEEKIQLGRDLHDGIIQSLYSAGLMLEAARSRIKSAPDESSAQIQQTLELLNGTIRDVRGYINALSPEQLRREGFKQALMTIAEDLRAQRDVSFDLRIDDQAADALIPEQARAVLQIAREAISNSLRHGKAGKVALLLGLENDRVVLLIRDNGTGFDAAQRRPDAHGLRNMEARIAQLAGNWELRSAPGEGTVIRLDLPVAERKTS